MSSPDSAVQPTDHHFAHGRVLGLDSLRLFALSMVTWQHAASVLGAYVETQWRGISPGQIGVAIFCAISGYLAFRAASGNIMGWFFRRLLGIFPSYWVVTLVAFAMALVFGSSKPISLGLFVSQMLGLGYFTHGWELINVVSWFVSLILACYGLSLAARKTGYPATFWVVICLLAAMAIATRAEVDLSRHILAFALGALYGTKGNYSIFAPLAITLMGIGISVDPQFFYAGLALFLLIMGISGWVWEPHFLRKISIYSYEYFLVHGICLVAATKYILNASIAVTVAVAMASALAVVLHFLDQFMQGKLKRVIPDTL